jgi:hypothetical protein
VRISEFFRSETHWSLERVLLNLLLREEVTKVFFWAFWTLRFLVAPFKSARFIITGVTSAAVGTSVVSCLPN